MPEKEITKVSQATKLPSQMLEEAFEGWQPDTLKELNLKKETLRNIAFKNGWVTGKHIFNYLDEIQMHRYDVIQGEIDKIKYKQSLEQEWQEKIKKMKESIDDIYHKLGKEEVFRLSNDVVCDECEEYFKKQISKLFGGK